MSTPVDAGSGELLWKTRADDHPCVQIVNLPVYFDRCLFVSITADEEGPARCAAVGNLRGERLVGAHDRPRAAGAPYRHQRQFLRARPCDERGRHGARSQYRQNFLDMPDHRPRRLQSCQRSKGQSRARAGRGNERGPVRARYRQGGKLGGIQWNPATDGRLVLAAVFDITFAADLQGGRGLVDDPGAGAACSRWMPQPDAGSGPLPHPPARAGRSAARRSPPPLPQSQGLCFRAAWMGGRALILLRQGRQGDLGIRHGA